MNESCCTPRLAPTEESAPENLSGQNLLTLEEEDQLASLCKALGHPARIRILRILLDKSECVCGDLVELMPLAQSTVSEHLRVLKDAGLVEGRIDGPRRCYCAAPEALQALKGLLARL